ncbi:MAG: sulfate reduction electron transfer complex DsrMKJOP subunit DsrM [Gordonibacter sp.]|uniref:sulfate reduction electron transfer complex DsrMKJOP subunit DsrM n=1 Tax=Gordonibacter sp. TaxID=1968902 RepID=UPI002FC8935A
MKIAVPLVSVLALALVAWICTAYLNLYTLFGVIIPYAAFALFVIGFVVRIVRWGTSAVPFRIPTTCGQQKSLPWIKQAKTDNPSSYAGVVGRMLLEVLFFRSLFRNSKVEKCDDKLVIGSAKWLWLGALVFHWSMLVIVLRHFRLFLDPVPIWVQALEGADSAFQIGIPILYLTDVFVVAGLTFLFLRRVVVPRIRYLSLSVDYFPLFLLLGIAVSGIVMRYAFRVDLTSVKELTMGLVTFNPVVGAGIEPLLFVHVFLVSVLLVYFPWSKLMHSGGVFFSPTRNLANNNRARRHVNPWNYPVQVHTYAEYEEEFGEKMKKVGLPLDAE